VNVGQTVVASLNAPSLFLIAKDLKRMQVWVAVNEADIGRIRPGQDATFTVDAFPSEPFRGKVGKVRLNASMTQNVVTYTVEVVADNSKGRLLPYLTANVQFELDRRKNVLLVPNAALRWTPSAEQLAPNYRAAFQDSSARDEKPQGNAQTASSAGQAPGEQSEAVLWVAEGSHVRPVSVTVGLSDDIKTEVAGKGLTEGMEVIVGAQTQSSDQTEASSQTETTNPFTPKIPKREKALGPPPPM
jgi:HlyD family secretion protein